METRDYVLGLDLGPNSIGWALLKAQFTEQGGHETYRVQGLLETAEAGHPPLGVRVFEAGLDNFGTANEESLAQRRRGARSMRRNHQRRNARRKALRKALTKAGLLPQDPKEQEALFAKDPYALRARGLDGPLSPHELGRALYHLGQRRGFKSNRKTAADKETEGILKEMGELASEINDSGARTLGEYLHRLEGSAAATRAALLNGQARLRHRHTRRDMYEHEFDMLVEAQRDHHPEALSTNHVQSFRRAIFFQHPFEITEERRRQAPGRANLHRAPSVKRCPLIPSEYCCHKGDWHAQYFRVLKEVNNLKVYELYSADPRNLREVERKAVLDRLMTSESATFDQLRKTLAKLGADPSLSFNLEKGERGRLDGNSIEAKLKNTFGARRWRDLDSGVKHELRDGLLKVEDPEKLEHRLAVLGAPQEKAHKTAGWTPRDGYLGYSKPAIMRLLPHLEAGLNEYEAIQESFPDRAEPDMRDVLPPLNAKELPGDLRDLTNPVVRRALVELRKVVNAIVREHGLPRRIVVELARDMKDGAEARKKRNKFNAQRRRDREDAREAVFELQGRPNSREDVDRYLLWKEQSGVCLYTGKPIPQSQLFGGEWDVDHILPHWRSLDDSYANKVLVSRRANADKGNQTPAEWLGADSEDHRLLIQRAEDAYGTRPELQGKLSRLRQETVDSDDFAQRQLNDTRYLTKSVIQYLKILYPPELRRGEMGVQSSRGSLTAELRRQWGLNNVADPLCDLDGNEILEESSGGGDTPTRKSRADHRHHAIDAVVIAASSRAMLKRYQDHWKRGISRDAVEPPWPGFRDDVAEAARQINVSHRVRRGLHGAFHEDTFFGPAKNRRGPIPGRFVTRKPLQKITKATHVDAVRDPFISTLIRERLKTRGWDGKSSDLPKDWAQPELTMPSGVPIRKVRMTVSKRTLVQLSHRYAVLGNNHHIAFFEDCNGKVLARVAPVMEVAERVRREKKPPVNTDVGNDMQFLFSLSRKDSVLLKDTDGGASRLAVVQRMSGEITPNSSFDLYLRDARDSRPATKGDRTPLARIRSSKKWAQLSPRKVQVDPLGRIFPAKG